MSLLPIFVVASLDKSESGIIDPNQGDLFPDSMAPELPPAKPSPEVKPKERRRRKPRVLFSPERIKGLPIKVIEIDPAGDLSSLKKRVLRPLL